MTDRILRRAETCHRCGFSVPGLYKAMREGRFPKPVRIGPRAVGWRESDIQAWMDSLPTAGDAADEGAA